MNERRLQFRVGLLAISAVVIAGWLVFRFGDLRKLWQPTYQVEVLFDRAPDVYAGTPVRINGMKIGSISEVRLDDAGVIAVLELDAVYPVFADAEVNLSRGLLGDASINVLPGRSRQPVSADTPIIAQPYVDPMEAVTRMEANVAVALESFQSTSEEWRKVGTQLSDLLETNRGNLDAVVERTAESLHEFTIAMQSFSKSADQANAILGDPRNQENLRRTLEAVPVMVEDTRAVIAAVRTAVQKADENLANLAEATGPLADRSASIATRLDSTLANLESLSAELNEFAHLVNDKDGTLRAMATNPSLYRNLDRSAESLTVLLANLEPVLRDMRVFSDKIARRPELMGLGGALAPSDGTKGVQPASLERSVQPGTARVGSQPRRSPN
ncbi:MAG: MlaD family protein [Planctomycetota bacterium]|nr:MCE family protein [Planctomycetaceae bacterium]MDQ3329683.1 MlaD family protein [Planctomycetota bacterium]